jgi:hypothetical protein
MTKRQKSWVYSPSKPAKPKIAAGVKLTVERQAQALMDTVLKPRHIQPPPPDAEFNYIVDIYGKWYRNYFSFCAQYACPGSNALAPFFEAKFARLECIDGHSRFNLAFMRYTGEWIEVYPDLSLARCLRAIKNDPFFQL